MKIAALLFIFFPAFSLAQDLTGTWTGTAGRGASFLKMVIIQVGDSCFGYTYDEGPGFCKADFEGSFEQQGKKLKGRGMGFIARSSGHSLGVYNLNYFRENGEEYLEGTLAPKGAGAVMLSLGMSSYAQLKKSSEQVDTTRFMAARTRGRVGTPPAADTTLPIAKHVPPESVPPDNTPAGPELALPETVIKDKQVRESKMVQTIYTNADTVHMMLYDNGVVDDDTVTVFLDDAVILDRYRITDRAKALHFPVNKNGRQHVVELFANNLGTIPPNTALIVITAGKDRYEIHASYDLSTNAKIIFQYKE